ncbi:helix-turn-helix domain-containing protein [Streptomyces sp. NPDC087539]|uniref:helix-turn-helix domain-containing protein n=1 Tax=Streptomyces sp. NPDC087539 TaxID=3365798 RepID=UPI0037FE7993
MTEADVFPPGQRALAAESTVLSRPVCAHTHDFAEFAFVRSGRAEQHTERGVTTLREGSLIVMAPGGWHAIEPENQVTLTNVYLSGSLLNGELAWLADLPRIGPVLRQSPGRRGSTSAMTLELDPTIHRRTEEPLERFVEANDQNLFSRLARLFDLLAALTPALEDSGPGQDADTRPPHHRRSSTASHLVTHHRHSVAHAIAVLHDRIDQNWTLKALARETALSPSQLARVFRADTGTSPMAYLQQIRAERLAYLLRTTDTTTVAAAAHAVGWNDPSYAARRFRAHWHTTPHAYRNRVR